MKKITTILICVIIALSTILIIRPKKEVWTNAATPQQNGENFRITNPFIEYLGENWYTGTSNIRLGILNAGYQENHISTEREITNSTESPARRYTYINSITVSNNNGTMRATIQYSSYYYNNTSSSNNTSVRIEYEETNQNGTWSVTNGVLGVLGVSTIQELLDIEWTTSQNFLQLVSTFNSTYGSGNYKYIAQFMQTSAPPRLTTPTLELDFNTLLWNVVPDADYYAIYRNGVIYATTYDNQYTTIVNGNYQVQACVNIDNEEYSNSELSNTIVQNQYNDVIGNGANFFTLFSAIIDSQIYLIKSMLNYEIWGINIFNVFRLLVTIAIILIIYKIIRKGN